MSLTGWVNPVGWVLDRAGEFAGGAAMHGMEAVIAGLTAWILDAVVWVVGAVFGFFLDATEPNVTADWFVAGGGPYATTAAIGATLLVGFLLAGIAQGVLAGDVGGMLRRIALDLPLAVLGMVGLVVVTQVLIRLTDELSGAVLGHFSEDIARFTDLVKTVGALTGGITTAFVIVLLGLLTVLAGLVLVAVLVVRSALIYVVVALAPLVFATLLWPVLRSASRRLLELLVALVVSKLVIAVALAVASAALVGAGSGGEVTALTEPEVVSDDQGGSVAQAVGILLAALAAFGVAAFSPLLVARLLPLTEAAVVGAGVAGGPLRAGHQAMAMGNAVHLTKGRRMTQVASARIGPGSTGAGSASSAAGAAGGAAGGSGAAGGAVGAGAAAGPVGAAVVVAGAGARAAGRAARKGATGTAEAASGVAHPPGDRARRPDPPPPQQPPPTPPSRGPRRRGAP